MVVDLRSVFKRGICRNVPAGNVVGMMNESAFSLRLCEDSGTSVLLDETDGTVPVEGCQCAPDACALFPLTLFALLLGPYPLAPFAA